MNTPVQQPGIYVKDENGQNLANIPLYITGNSLNGDASSQLAKFIDVARKSATFNKIYVQDSNLKDKLSGYGLPVEVKTINVTDEQTR